VSENREWATWAKGTLGWLEGWAFWVSHTGPRSGSSAPFYRWPVPWGNQKAGEEWPLVLWYTCQFTLAIAAGFRCAVE